MSNQLAKPAKEDESVKARLRVRALEMLEEQIEHAVLITRAEGNAGDNIRLMAELRNLAGLEEKNKYDNIPHITMVFGQDYSQQVTVKPVARQSDQIVEAVDVTPKAAPAVEAKPAAILPELAHLDALLNLSDQVVPVK